MKDYVVFSIGSNKQTAKDFAKFWNCQLGKVEVKKFADGEMLVKPLTNVEDKDVIVIESTAKKPNDHIMQILMLLDSIKRGNARSVLLIIPYLGYSRQERINYPNEPISCEVMAKVLETAQYDKLISFDLHHPIIETFFTRGIKNIPTTEIFTNYYSSYLKDNNYDSKDVVVVSPDHGSNYRADSLVFRLRGSNKIILDKVRPEPDLVEHLEVNDDVKDKVCIIIDDIISTGNTIASSAKLLYKAGAKAVLVGATHGVFSGDAIEKMKKAGIKDIAVTNTIEQGKVEGITVLDILPLIIENI